MTPEAERFIWGMFLASLVVINTLLLQWIIPDSIVLAFFLQLVTVLAMPSEALSEQHNIQRFKSIFPAGHRIWKINPVDIIKGVWIIYPDFYHSNRHGRKLVLMLMAFCAGKFMYGWDGLWFILNQFCLLTFVGFNLFYERLFRKPEYWDAL